MDDDGIQAHPVQERQSRSHFVEVVTQHATPDLHDGEPDRIDTAEPLQIALDLSTICQVLQ